MFHYLVYSAILLLLLFLVQIPTIQLKTITLRTVRLYARSHTYTECNYPHATYTQ